MKRNQSLGKNFIECKSFKDAIQDGNHMNRQMKCAMKMASLGLWEWSLDTDEVILSDEVFVITGLNQDDFDEKMTYIVGKLIHLKDRAKFMKSMALARREGVVRNLTYRINHQVNDYCYVKFNSELISNKDGKVIRLIGTLRDVTEEHIEKLKLKNNLAFVKSIVESLPTPIYYKSINGHYKYCNEALLNFIGRKREDIIGKTVKDIVPEELAQMYQYADESLLTNKESQMFEGKMLHKDGSLHTVLFSKAAHINEGGYPEGIVGVMQDISNQKSIEREVQMLYKAKDVFLNINRNMMSYKDEKEFFNSIQMRLQEVFEHAHQSTVLQLNEDNTLTILINSGYEMEESNRFIMPFEESFMWKETDGLMDSSHVINDIQHYTQGKDQKVLATEVGEEVESALMIPLKVEGVLRWILSFDSTGNYVFDEIDQFVAEYIREELPTVYRMFELYQKTLMLSRYDGLTGLMNRRYYEYVLEEKMHRAEYSKESLVVLLFDLDGLKKINDNNGHHAGDIYLKSFVKALKATFKQEDCLARIGGDEFTGTFGDVDIEELTNTIERIRTEFEARPMVCEGFAFNGSFSYGLSIYPEDSKDMSHLLQLADENMYKDKLRKRS